MVFGQVSKVSATWIDLPPTICCAFTVTEYGPSTYGDRVADVYDRMPQVLGRDTEHAVYTDHSIRRRPPPPVNSPGGVRSLTAFWKTPVDDRDLGLAYAVVAGPDTRLRTTAFELLRKAAARDAEDVPVLVQLAQLYDQAGNQDQAAALCERILHLDPAQSTVAVNLGTYYIQRGRAPEEMRLWADALSRNPGLTGARINLAVVQYRSGDAAAAEATLRQALKYEPDQDTARKFLADILVGAR